jgi:sugar phosphate isomerase/epimerase
MISHSHRQAHGAGVKATDHPAKASRRHFLAMAGASLATASPLLAASADTQATPSTRPADEPFGYCLNTSTLMGQNLGIVKVVEIAAAAGFVAIEPWLRELDTYVKGGGSLKDLGKRIADLGMTVESAIGFASWIVDDDAQRAAGLEQMKRDMDSVAQIGGKRIAAPPSGANKSDYPELSLLKAAQRYRAVCDLGDQMGVVPEAELWGPSKNLNRLGEAAMVAIDSGHPKACILPDVYHLYKGGSDPNGLRLLSGSAIHVIHMNDYPADPPRETITDAARVFPGDGVAPLAEILTNMYDGGYRGYLSLELFNRDYWKRSPVKVAREGIEKMRAVVQRTFNHG